LNVPHEAKRSVSLESTVYSPTIINTPSTVTPNIKPTIFTTRHEPPEYSPNVRDVASQSSKGQTSSFLSNPSLSIPRPLLTQNLQAHIDDLLSTLSYNQQTAEISLQETLDDYKVELQLEKEKAIEEIEEFAHEVLEDVKSQMEDLSGGYLVGFEDLLQRRREEVKEMQAGGSGVGGEGMVRGRDGYDDRVDLMRPDSQRTVVSAQLQITDVKETPPSAAAIADTPATAATAATKIFLHDFKHFCLADKVKVLERLAGQNTAEIFLTVDTELREAWVRSWIV
jgi:hypothetical protein